MQALPGFAIVEVIEDLDCRTEAGIITISKEELGSRHTLKRGKILSVGPYISRDAAADLFEKKVHSVGDIIQFPDGSSYKVQHTNNPSLVTIRVENIHLAE